MELTRKGWGAWRSRTGIALLLLVIAGVGCEPQERVAPQQPSPPAPPQPPPPPPRAVPTKAVPSPWSAYIHSIHFRIHPIFAGLDLKALDGLPRNHPLNDPQLYTSLEIVLDKATGKIVRMGVTKASGVSSFDMQAIHSVEAAAPFGEAPEVIASPDGNVYLHWEFHRDPFDACTTRNTRPMIFKATPSTPVLPEPATP